MQLRRMALACSNAQRFFHWPQVKCSMANSPKAIKKNQLKLAWHP